MCVLFFLPLFLEFIPQGCSRWKNLKAKHNIFVGVVVVVDHFSIQWVVVFGENVILFVVFLKNAVLWVSFIQMGFYGLFGFKYKDDWEKTLPIL